MGLQFSLISELINQMKQLDYRLNPRNEYFAVHTTVPCGTGLAFIVRTSSLITHVLKWTFFVTYDHVGPSSQVKLGFCHSKFLKRFLIR